MPKKRLPRHKASRTGEMRACPLCPFLTLNPVNLYKHINVVHLTNNPYKCDVCKKILSSKASLKNHKILFGHFENKMVNDTLHECKFCNYGCFDYTKVRMHEKLLHCNVQCTLREEGTETPMPDSTEQTEQSWIAQNELINGNDGSNECTEDTVIASGSSDEVCIRVESREDFFDSDEEVQVVFESGQELLETPVVSIEEKSPSLRFHPIKCQFCNTQFPTSEHLDSHLWGFHDIAVTVLNTC